MAEYWKSAPRHWCKQCKIFIRDTPFEKTQHEASPKHQGSLKRFLRDIHKNNEIQQRESQRAKSEVERLRQAVGGGSSTAKDASTSSRPAPAPAPKAAEKPGSIEDRKKQMAQLAEMGVAIPQEFRADMSLAGEWQTFSETNVAADGLEGASKSIGVRKRKLEGGEEGEEEEDEHAPGKTASQGWGSKLRTYPGQQDDDADDLDALLSSSKEFKKVKTEATEGETQEGKKEPALVKKEDGESESAVKTVKTDKTDKSPDVKTEAETPEVGAEPAKEEVTGFTFKKRKPKVMRK